MRKTCLVVACLIAALLQPACSTERPEGAAAIAPPGPMPLYGPSLKKPRGPSREASERARASYSRMRALQIAKADLEARRRREKGVGYRYATLYSPLHRAVRELATARVLELLKSGADCAARDRQGNTPLHLIADKTKGTPMQRLVVAEALMAAGADPDACNLNGVTALASAILARDVALEFYLRDEGDGQLLCTFDGPTPNVVRVHGGP